MASDDKEDEVAVRVKSGITVADSDGEGETDEFSPLAVGEEDETAAETE